MTFLHMRCRGEPEAEWDEDVETGGPVICPADDGHRRSFGRTGRLKVILRRRRIKDVVRTFLSEYLIQDNVLGILRDNHFTGFEVYGASARYRRGDEIPPRLWELRVTGWGGMAHPDSGIRKMDECPACGYWHYSMFTDPGRLIDESRWDGSDIFMVWPLPRYIFATSRVAKALHDAGVSGCHFELVGDLESRGDGLSPGRVVQWFDEPRGTEFERQVRRDEIWGA